MAVAIPLSPKEDQEIPTHEYTVTKKSQYTLTISNYLEYRTLNDVDALMVFRFKNATMIVNVHFG